MAEIFIYLFTAKLHDVTITSLLCLCIICYKTDIPPADSFVNGSTSVVTLWFQSEFPAWVRQTWSSLILVQRSIVHTSSYYCWFVLGKGLLPDIQARCHQHKCTDQQDGAPAHTAHNTTDYLKKEKIDFIEPDMWPQTVLILMLMTVLFGGPSAKSLPWTKI